jgi:ssDNA-binding Zn-finger/Zn-ribbon topoisomerase 1
VPTSEICPACGNLLKHNFRDHSAKRSGYNFWTCTNYACAKSFNDDMGLPGAERKKSTATLSEYTCPDCGKPLRHLVKEDDANSRGYNFWGCSGFPECKTTLVDEGGKPGAKNQPRDTPSGFLCPRCQSDLYHLKGVSKRTGMDYDFFKCSNPNCRTIFNTRNDEPDIPEVIRQKLKESGLSIVKGS